MRVGQLLDQGAFRIGHCGLIHVAPVAFVQLQRLKAAEFGLGAQLPRDRVQLREIPHPNRLPPCLMRRHVARRFPVLGLRLIEGQPQAQGRGGVRVGADRHRRGAGFDAMQGDP